jgi:MFS family permease
MKKMSDLSNTPYRQGTLAVYRSAWVVSAIFVMSNAATPLYSHWQQVLGFSSGTLTVIFASYIVGLLLTLTIAGQLSDHFGRKAMLLPCVGIAFIAAVLFDQAQSVALLMLARLLTGIAVGLVVSGGMANVVEHAEPHRKPFAALMASVAMVAGAGTGPLLAGFIASRYPAPVHPVFVIEVGLLLLALVAVLRQPNRKAGHGRFSLKLPSVPRANVGVLLAGISFFGPGITSTSFVLSLGPKLIALLLGANSPLIAGCMAFSMFVVAVGVQLLARKLGNRRVFYASGISTMTAMLCAGLALKLGSAAWFLAAALLAGAGQGLGQLGGLRLIAEHVGAGRRAEANALFNIGGYVPAGIIPVAAGYLVDACGLQVGVLALAWLIAAMAGVALYRMARSRLAIPTVHF